MSTETPTEETPQHITELPPADETTEPTAPWYKTHSRKIKIAGAATAVVAGLVVVKKVLSKGDESDDSDAESTEYVFEESSTDESS